MSSLEIEINEYLFWEFGFDSGEGEEARISKDWPFVLRRIGDWEDGVVYEFDHNEPFFMYVGTAGSTTLMSMPKAGMTLEDLKTQEDGSEWIGSRDPVDLDTHRLGDSAVPPGLERQKALEQLARDACGAQATVLEGLFLVEEQCYVALVGPRGANQAFVVGLTAEPLAVGFPEASKWRRLAWGVGRSLEDGAVSS